MHALLSELFPWIVALYLADAVAQLGRGHLLLVGARPRRFRLRRAGLHLAALSPFAEVVAAQDLPWLASPAHVYLFDPRRRSDPALVAREDLEALPRAALAPVAREGRKVTAGGRIAIVAPTAEWAERIRSELAALAGSPAVPAADPRRDLGAARALAARAAPWEAAIRGCTALLFATVFAAWPAAAYAPAAVPLAPGSVVAVAGVLVACVAALAHGMLRACGETRRQSAAAALHLLAYPIAALRPLAHAPRSLYRAFDAMTIAAVLLPAPAFRSLAARELRRARLCRAATDPELAPAWDARARQLVALLAAVGIPEREALAPPPRAAQAAAWCPLCEAQYRAGFGWCGDCGVAAEPFAS